MKEDAKPPPAALSQPAPKKTAEARVDNVSLSDEDASEATETLEACEAAAQQEQKLQEEKKKKEAEEKRTSERLQKMMEEAEAVKKKTEEDRSQQQRVRRSASQEDRSQKPPVRRSASQGQQPQQQPFSEALTEWLTSFDALDDPTAMVQDSGWNSLHFTLQATEEGGNSPYVGLALELLDRLEERMPPAALSQFVNAATASHARRAAGWTPLHLVANNFAPGRAEIIKALVRRKASLETRSRTDNTPLMPAASTGHMDAVMTLIELRADVFAKKEGSTLVNMAQSKRQIQEIFLGMGVQKGEPPSGKGRFLCNDHTMVY